MPVSNDKFIHLQIECFIASSEKWAINFISQSDSHAIEINEMNAPKATSKRRNKKIQAKTIIEQIWFAWIISAISYCLFTSLHCAINLALYIKYIIYLLGWTSKKFQMDFMLCQKYYDNKVSDRYFCQASQYYVFSITIFLSAYVFEHFHFYG